MNSQLIIAHVRVAFGAQTVIEICGRARSGAGELVIHRVGNG